MVAHWYRYANIFLAVLFFSIGFLTFLNVAAAWHIGSSVPWSPFGYGVLDWLLAYGFMAEEPWIWVALGLNALGVGVLILLHIDYSIHTVTALIISTALAILYGIHPAKHPTTYTRVTALLFIAIWAVIFWYTIVLGAGI